MAANGLRLNFPRSIRRSHPMLRTLSGLLMVAMGNVNAQEFYFAPSSLEGDELSQQDIDLSLFSKENGQLPGTYQTKININKQNVDEESIIYISSKSGALLPQLPPLQLRKWGVRVDAYPELTKLTENEPLHKPIGDYIPFASAAFDFNAMTLRISMPQAAIDEHHNENIDPSRWNDGVPVMFADYSFSGSRRENAGSDNNNGSNNSQYLNLRSGANLGGWRLRNYSTWRQSGNSQSWQTINTWLQHDIHQLEAQFIAGENSTRGDVFDSLQFRGINVASDDQMLPYNQRGFAPIIRGIASSNAEVSIRQNGYVIYQANVAPGAFEIRDLYSTTNSADLEITVKEADGTEHRFTQPYSSVAVMQRPGNIRYEMTLARYRADDNQASNEPLFAQGSAIYGLNNYFTLFGGSTLSSDYQAFDGGIGVVLGDLGSVSTDVTWARARLDNGEQHDGQSWRLMYTKKIETTDTNFSLASYRDSTSGYYNFADANEKYDDSDDNIDWSHRYNKRSRVQLNINQTVLDSSIYISAYQQDYWQTSHKERSISSGINRTIGDISVNLAYTYSKTSDDSTDQMLSLSFSVPLSRWLPKSWASYNLSSSKQGDTSHSVGLNGTLLDDDRLSYSLQQSHTNHGGTDNSSIYGSYRSQYANLNAGYYYASDSSRQLTYGVSGAVVAHPAGVTLSQPLGDQFAIVSAKGASGVRFTNQRGVQTDYFGNAIIPSLTPYQENTIYIDTTSLPDDVDTDETTMTVIPSRSAAVSTQFTAHVGYRALISLTRPDGRIIPFGAVASVDGLTLGGIVDDRGVLYLSGVSENVPLTVTWGSSAEQRCHASATLSPSSDSAPNGIRQTSALCKPEANHAE